MSTLAVNSACSNEAARANIETGTSTSSVLDNNAKTLPNLAKEALGRLKSRQELSEEDDNFKLVKRRKVEETLDDQEVGHYLTVNINIVQNAGVLSTW